MSTTVEIGGKEFRIFIIPGRIVEFKVKDVTVNNLEGIKWGDARKESMRITFENCTIESLKGLQELKSVNELLMRDSVIKGDLDINECGSLSRVLFNGVEITKGASFILNLTKLRTLEIYKVKGLNNLSLLGDLPALSSLLISSTRLSNIDTIKKMTTLKFIRLDDCNLSSLEGLEAIIKQNPELKSISFKNNPIKTVQDIDGIVKWDIKGINFVPKILHSTLKISLPSEVPRPKPKPITETYKISDEETSCGYCGKTIPPRSDYFINHVKQATKIFKFSDVKLRGVQKKHTSRKYLDSTYYKVVTHYTPAPSSPLHLRSLNGPICKACSDQFVKESDKILEKLKTENYKKVAKEKKSIQGKFDKMHEKWSKKYKKV